MHADGGHGVGPGRVPAAALLLALLGVAAPLRSEPPGPPPPAPALETALTLERVFGGPPIHAPLADWSWRPGHAQLIRIVTTKSRDELVALSPEDGTERTLLDLKALEALVPERGPGEEGIGRAGPDRLVWKPDGTALAVLVQGERVWVDLATGARRRLTHGGPPRSDVQVAPDGAHVLFARERGPTRVLDPERLELREVESRDVGLWLVPTDGSRAPQPLVSGGRAPDVLEGKLDWLYPEELGLDHAAWWSPDSKRIAYLTLDETGVPRHVIADSLEPEKSASMWYPRAGERNPVASVAVRSLDDDEGGGCVLDLGDPAPEYVVRVAWTPDAARVLVVTLDRAQRHLRLRSCDPTTGKGTTLFEERDDAWIDPPPTPRFVGTRAFLWRSARGRWLAYALASGADAVRGSPTPLTAEGLVVTDVLTPPHARAAEEREAAGFLVQGAERAARRSAIWRALPDGTQRPWLSASEGSVSAVLDDGGSLALVRRSSTLRPPVLEVRRTSDATLARTLGDALTPAYEALDLPQIEGGALASDEGSILWRLWKPRALAPGRRYAVVVTVYGGPGSRTVDDAFDRGPYFPALLVQEGFLVLQVDGRGTGGQGPGFERKVVGRLGVLELEDQVRAVRALAERPYVDASRVGIFGWSYGGTMVVHALTRAGDVFRAGVAVAPVTDWRLYDTIYTERYMGTPEANPAGYDEASGLKHAAGFRGGLLLLHGLADDNVHPENTTRLVEALLAAKASDFDWRLYPNRGHGLGGATRDVFGRVLAWFRRTLQGG